MVNRGEEKVRVHMNVVLRSTICVLVLSLPVEECMYMYSVHVSLLSRHSRCSGMFCVISNYSSLSFG